MILTEYMVQSPNDKLDFIYNRTIFIWHNNYNQQLRAFYGKKLNKETRKYEDVIRINSNCKLMFKVKLKSGVSIENI